MKLSVQMDSNQNDRICKKDAEAILKPFTEDLLRFVPASLNTDSDSPKCRARALADMRREVLKIKYAQVETLIFKRYQDIATLVKDIIGSSSPSGSERSAFQEALGHYAADRPSSRLKHATPKTQSRDRTHVDLLYLAKKAKEALLEINKAGAFWKALANRKTEHALDLLGVDYAHVVNADTAPSKWGSILMQVQASSARAKEKWGITLDSDALCFACAALKEGPRLTTIDALSQSYLNAWENAAKAIGMLSDKLKEVGSFSPNTTVISLDSLDTISHQISLDGHCPSDALLTELEKMGDLAQSRIICDTIKKTRKETLEILDNLNTQRQNISASKAAVVLEGLFGKAPTPENSSLRTAIKSCVQVAATQLSQHSNKTGSARKTEIFSELLKRKYAFNQPSADLRRLLGIAEKLCAGEIIEHGTLPDEESFWQVVTMHAMEIAVRHHVAEIIQQLELKI